MWTLRLACSVNPACRLPHKSLKRPMGKQGQDVASHCFCPQQTPGGGSYRPGKTENTVTMTTGHEPQDRYWGTWARGSRGMEMGLQGAGCGVLWNLGFPLLPGLPAK